MTVVALVVVALALGACGPCPGPADARDGVLEIAPWGGRRFRFGIVLSPRHAATPTFEAVRDTEHAWPGAAARDPASRW